MPQYSRPTTRPQVNVVSVADAAALGAALSSAKTSNIPVLIVCSPGNYGSLVVGYSGNFLSGVTVTSNNDAIFNTITIDGVGNITLQNLVINYEVNTGSSRAVFIKAGCSTVKCIGLSVTSTIGIGNGIQVNNYCSNVEIIANEVYGAIGTGISVISGTNIKIHGNKVHDYITDAFFMGDVNGLEIVGNTVYNGGPYTAEAHADFIQFYSAADSGIYPARNVTIRDNKLMRGANAQAGQGVFMRDESSLGGYNNFLIENNIIGPLSTVHGIAMGGGTEPVWNNTVVKNNTVLHDANVGTSIHMKSTESVSSGNQIINNVANAYTINTPGVSQSGNLTVLNTEYNALFINGWRGLYPEDFLPVPGSAVDFGNGVGADVLMQTLVRPVYWIATAIAGLVVTATATPYRDPDLDETGVTYAWASSDGGSGTGKIWEHTFPGAGTYTITVTVNGSAYEKTVILS